MSAPMTREKKQLLFKLAVIGAGVLLGGVLVLKGVDLRAWIERGLDILRGAGPLAFFAAMAFLPAAGVPMLTFTLTAGPAFGEQMGMGTVLACGVAALVVNIAVTYWLATQALRPLLERLLAWLGYKLPTIESGDMTDMIVILRVTPGLPFFAQSYLLGLAKVPFGKYLLISSLIACSLNSALMFFGDALLHGKGKVGLIALSALIALVAFTHLLRRHYGRKATKP